MNVQLDSVISDIMGVTGQRILRAIVDGERDPQMLAAMRDRRTKSSASTIASSLEGTWREEHLFALKQADIMGNVGGGGGELGLRPMVEGEHGEISHTLVVSSGVDVV